MSYSDFKKRKSKGSFRVQGRRKHTTHTDYTRKIKRLGIYRWVILALIIIVFIVGVGVPLGIYLSNSQNNPYVEEQSQGEYFTQEQEKDLILTVNKANPLSSEHVPTLTDIGNVPVNEIAQKDLQEMLNAANKDSVNLQLETGYISFEEQNRLYEETLNSIKEKNKVSQIKAESETTKIVPKAGESEAQTGLLITFSDKEESNFVKSKSFSWLSENAMNYGFVLRYPNDKEDVTNMSYNPSLYRFVGKNNALQMRIFGMCLEEYREYVEQKEKN